jgi:hypothetical protein
MHAGYSWVAKTRFYTNLILAYVITAALLGYVAHPIPLFPNHNARSPIAATSPKLEPNVLTGKPVRIIVPRFNIDLAVEDGIYNPGDQTWSLSGYGAQYATPSIPPNDKQGTTLIYGHNNKYVFGPLNKHAPVANDVAEIITSNGHAFFYTFDSSSDVKPDNMGVFQYGGKPVLAIQTCSGNWNEWRRLFRFNFERAE